VLIPPFAGQFLMSGYDQVAACAGGEVARDGRFEIDLWLHQIHHNVARDELSEAGRVSRISFGSGGEG
jgi:hypothetical protein